MAAYPTAQLREICDTVEYGYTASSSTERVGPKFLRITDIVPDRIDWGNVPFCEIDSKKLSKHRLRTGDIVIARTGATTGWAKYINNPPEAVFASYLVRVRPVETVDARYVGFVIESPIYKEFIQQHMGGAAQPNANAQVLTSFDIPLPPLPIQRRIAGILSAYDDLIENNQRRIRILEDMARSLYREWFVHFRYPGHESVPLVDSPLGQIPQGWEVRRLGDVANIFRGRSYRSVDLADEGGLPFLNLKCLDRDGGFRRSGLKRYIGEFKDTHIAKKGDIIMAVTDMTQERRIVARAAMVPTLDNEFGIFSMDLVRIEPKHELPKAYLYSFLRYSSFADEVKQHANGANVLHLSPDRITDYRSSIPPKDLMNSFTSFAAPVIAEIDTLENKIENLRSTRDLLLPRLLSGQIDVAVAEDEISLDPQPSEKIAKPAEPASKPVPESAPVKTVSVPIDSTEREEVLCTIRKVFNDGQARDRETALRDIALALGYKRLGGRIREVVSADFLTAVRRGIVLNDAGLYRLGFRSFAECTRDSIKDVFESAIGRAWITRDDAIRAFARWAGFARTGDVIDQTARSLINGLIREGRVETDGPELIRRT